MPKTEAAAEDGVAAVQVEYDPQPVAIDLRSAMALDSPVVREKLAASAEELAMYGATVQEEAKGDSKQGANVGSADHLVTLNAQPVGGGFGGKFGFLEPTIAALTKAVGRPVRMAYTRMEEFGCADPAPRSLVRVKIGAKADGTLTTLDAETIFDSGAKAGAPGRVVPLNYVAIQDVGTAINPATVEGQMEGAAIQAVGWGLFEEIAWDEQGTPTTASLTDYAIPKASQAPPLGTVLVNVPSEQGAYGGKGVGEPPVIPGAAALANAVYQAVGAIESGTLERDYPARLCGLQTVQPEWG